MRFHIASRVEQAFPVAGQMTNTSANVLEFEALRALLGRYIASPLGRGELAKIQPRTDRVQLEEELAEAEEATEYLRAASKPQLAARRSGSISPPFRIPLSAFTNCASRAPRSSRRRSRTCSRFSTARLMH